MTNVPQKSSHSLVSFDLLGRACLLSRSSPTQLLSQTCPLNITVGWSYLLLCILFSKMGTLLPIRYIFMSSIPKFVKFCARASKFHFQKTTGKKEYFFENLQITSFTSRNFREKKENLIFWVSRHFAFKLTKEHIQVQPLKMLKYNFFSPILGPAPSQKANIS